jgi:hypothetical protein
MARREDLKRDDRQQLAHWTQNRRNGIFGAAGLTGA